MRGSISARPRSACPALFFQLPLSVLLRKQDQSLRAKGKARCLNQLRRHSPGNLAVLRLQGARCCGVLRAKTGWRANGMLQGMAGEGLGAASLPSPDPSTTRPYGSRRTARGSSPFALHLSSSTIRGDFFWGGKTPGAQAPGGARSHPWITLGAATRSLSPFPRPRSPGTSRQPSPSSHGEVSQAPGRTPGKLSPAPSAKRIHPSG